MKNKQWAEIIRSNRKKLIRAGINTLKDSLYDPEDPPRGTPYFLALFITDKGELERYYLKPGEEIPGEDQTACRVLSFRERALPPGAMKIVKANAEHEVRIWVDVKINTLLDEEGGF